MKVAVTGSSGFIGSFLLKSLKSQNYDVIEISSTKNLDIVSWDSVKTLPDFDVIVHLAAKSFVPDSFSNPYDFYYVNQTSTLNVLELARNRNAKVIYISSYLYGAPKYLPVDEKHELAPHNPYAQTKIICEKMCEGYYRDFKVPLTIFRPFNIYGPSQKEPFIIPSILAQLDKGEITLKDPRPKRDYIHVEDIVSAIMIEIEKPVVNCEIFNLGTGVSYSVEELMGFISKYAPEKPVVNYLNEFRQGEVLDTIADISKVSKYLKWKPIYDLERGIKELLSEKE